MGVQPKTAKRKPAKTKRRGKSGKAPGSRLTPAEVEEIFRRFEALDPNPKTELRYADPFTLLVAVVLSAQATDSSVNKATPDLFKAADTPERLAKLGEAKLTDKIKTIGLYRGKAKNVIALSKILIEQHGGKVPKDREALQALPGVGRKTANVVLNVAFGEPTIAVDTHIFRVSNRTNLAPGRTVEEVEEKLERVVPDQYKLHAHHWLILHGRYTCIARKPLCPICVVRDLCRFKDKTREAELEKPKAPRPKKSRT
jgi:endonuclease III